MARYDKRHALKIIQALDFRNMSFLVILHISWANTATKIAKYTAKLSTKSNNSKTYTIYGEWNIWVFGV